VLLALLTIAAPILRDPRRSWTWKKGLRSATALLTFVGLSLVFGIALQIASRGYAYDLLVRDPFRYGLVQPIRKQIGISLRFLAVPLGAMAVLVVCAAVSLVANRHRDQRRRMFVALAAVAVAASPIPSAIIAKAKLGGDVNQLAGPVWTLTIGCAVLLLLLRPSSRQIASSAIACGVLLVAITPFSHFFADHQLSASRLYPPQTWAPIDPFLQSAVDHGDAVFDSTVPSLSVSEKAPGYPAGNWIDQFAAGYVPRYFLQNLVDGRYTLVAPIPDSTDVLPYYSSDNEHYYSNLGRYDGSIPWKINQLLAMGYTPVTDPYSTAVYYQPSPKLKQLAWFTGCFGPYRAATAGVDVRVRGSGGLVCIDNGDLHLTKAPGPTTELVTKLREDTGQVVVRFDKAPEELGIYRLDSHDSLSPATAAPSCLNHYGSQTSVTIRPVAGNGGVVCRPGPGGSVLEVPVAGASTAHVSIVVAATDGPTVVAQSADGKSVPFTTVNPNP
jgi:hypothetical protein